MRTALYEGSTWHARHGRVAHTFRHDVWTWLFDLDELDALDRHLSLFGVDRPAPVSLRAEDHLIVDPARGWRPSVVDWLVDHEVTAPVERVELQTSPRVLGYTFNPLSLWWCWGPHGRLVAVIAEVHNTYGGRHAYLLHVDVCGRAETHKALYVSPFYAVEGIYRMRLSAPTDRFHVHVAYSHHDEHLFDATWSGERRQLDRHTLVRLLSTRPWGALRVAALIRLHGLRLWSRGLDVVPRQDEKGTP